MDLQFIKMIVESYYNDSKEVKTIYPNKKDFVNDLYPEIESILSTCRLEDMQVYLELYNDCDKRQQQKVLYTLIEYSLYDRYPDQFPLYENDYDKLYNKIILNESLTGIVGGVGLLASTLLGGAVLSQTTTFNKIKWGVLAKFQQVNEKIHKLIKDITKKGRVKLALTFNNAEECYQKCNIHSKQDISTFIGSGYRTAKSNDDIFKFETSKGREQAHCLTNCYLHWSLNQVQLLMQSYVNCLRSTGERGIDVNDISTFLMTAPSSEMCNPYFKLLKEHKSQFDEVLDVVCKDSMEKEEFLRLYNEAINKGASNTGRINSNDHYKFDKESFTLKSNNKPNNKFNNKFNKDRK